MKVPAVQAATPNFPALIPFPTPTWGLVGQAALHQIKCLKRQPRDIVNEGDRDIDREIEREIDKDKEREIDREIDRQRDRQRYRQR